MKRSLRNGRRTPGGLAALTAALAAGLVAGPVLAGPAAVSATQPTAAVLDEQDATPVAAPTSFTHPGVLVSRPQLDHVRAMVQAGEQPWQSAWDQMTSSRYGSLSYTPHPRAVVECGSYSNPNHGCTDERQDAIAAYTHALAWYVTRDDRHADKAIEIMNAWSAVIRDHTNSNAPLQTAWAGSVWPRAAEIVRYTSARWSASDIDRFEGMLRDVYLPEIINGSLSNGNWELSMTEATQGIGVFLDDTSVYASARQRFLDRVPAFIYLTSDGSVPRTVPGDWRDTPEEIFGYWHGQRTLVNGIAQETCRDFTHTGYGLSAISHVAETAAIQGDDLYPQVGDRLRHALGLHSTYQRGESAPSWLCGGSPHLGLGPVTEVGFNALGYRQGHAMTNTQALTEQMRPQGTNHLFVAWETLTHAENPNVIPQGEPAPAAGPIVGYGGKCTDVAGASTADGTAVQLWDCNGTDAQQWSAGPGNAVRALGKCLDVAGAGTSNGTLVQLYTCNGTNAQAWQHRSDGSLVNTGSGKCLDATGPSSANGTRLQIWTCTGGTNQHWTW
ncbi:ricin-type beta-trefoil lectin domain protein [Myceligenerans salitolerans]|uniref:ricin-type beta-trefoil lectin domain protein n=1 Tax=Myceligenerans salitolerans TaxID=1230528 RepID=UPI001F5F6404|nr:ricin-type beta-trefoil lectin domain protein [Myceligenerans salitolerans]